MNESRKNRLISIIDELIEEKLTIDDNFLRFTFFEVRVKKGVKEEEEKEFIQLAGIKLTNMGYTVYFQDQEFIYKEAKRRVQINELIIAIKDN